MPERSRDTRAVRRDRILKLREAAGMKQWELAQAADLSQGHLSRIEAGMIEYLGTSTLTKLAEALSTNIEYLLGRTDNPMPAPPSVYDKLSSDESTLLRILAAIRTPEFRLALLDTAKRFLELEQATRSIPANGESHEANQ